MSFKLTKTPTFKANVTIETMDEKGRTLKETVVATFDRPTEEELVEYAEGQKNSAICERFLRNVEGMVDENNEPVPYEGANRLALLSMPPATHALAMAFWQGARTGRAKN